MYIYTLYRKYCMKPLTGKEKMTAEKILLKKNISIDDIESFQFIKYDEYPEAHDKFWGRSLFRIKMKSGTFAYIRIYYNCSKRASALLRYLVSKGIEFSNYNKPYTTENCLKELSDKKYKRRFSEVEVLSILGIYSFIGGLFILNTKNNEPIFTAISGVVFHIRGSIYYLRICNSTYGVCNKLPNINQWRRLGHRKQIQNIYLPNKINPESKHLYILYRQT